MLDHVEQHLPLINKVMSLFVGVHNQEIREEMEGSARIALVKASRYYDPQKGKPSTYLVRCMYRAALKTLLRYKKRVMPKPFTQSEEEGGIVCPQSRWEFSEMENDDSVRHLKKVLRKQYSALLIAYAHGQRREEMAGKLGVTLDTISKVAARARIAARAALKGER